MTLYLAFAAASSILLVIPRPDRAADLACRNG